MPGWVVGVAVTLALSLISACGFLWLRCRGAGYPFGPHSRPWAITVVVVTAAISTALGVVVVVASHHVRAAYMGLVVPSVLWLGKASAQRVRRHGHLVPRQLAAFVMLPVQRLDEGIGDDLQDWCDARSAAVSGRPRQVADAAQYYYNQLVGRPKDDRAREQLYCWRESIRHKAKVVQMIGRGEPEAPVHAALQSHPATSGTSKYDTADLPRLARRLQSEAENELHLLLAWAYRRGYHKLLIYPFRPPPAPHPRHRPGPPAPEPAEPGPAVG
jgi:hypothetical protein